MCTFLISKRKHHIYLSPFKPLQLQILCLFFVLSFPSKKKKSMKYLWVVLYLLLNGYYCNGEIGDEVIGVVAPMEKTEENALFYAIQGFVGNSWNGSYLYPDPCGWTPIQGVSCDFIDGSWYVTDLNIGPVQDNSLKCAQNPEFRRELFELSHLKSLSFFECFTSRSNLISLPTDNWLKLAASLESLEFRSNPSLIGPISSVFGDLKNLQSLVLIENGFTGSLPSNLGNLRHLKRLVVSGNKCSGQIPDSIGNLANLLILDLSRNSLSGYLPTSIGYLKSLLKLDLGNNMLKGTIPTEISNLKNLTLLDLRNNRFSGGLITSLEEMDSLEEFVLSSNPIVDNVQNVDWQRMQNLMILDLSNLGLIGEIPKSMTKLKKLRYIGLSNNNLTGNLPIELANMPCVTTFYVNGNYLIGELKLPKGFYEKLGRRFGAWNNTNLCYPPELMLSDHAPLGVKQCKSNIYNNPVLKIGLHDGFDSLQQPPNMDQPRAKEEYGNLNPGSISSRGMSNIGSYEFWWILLVDIFIVALL